MREFDVEKMVRATGCKLTSVSNEIRHMIEDGYLTSLKPTGPHSRRGKPISTYRLVDDEEKIERLLAEVRTFRPQRSQGKPEPQSRNYQRAREFLDQAANTEHEAEKEGLLKQAETLLKIARADEGEPESVKSAFLQFELGRLFFLRKDYQLADKLLRQSAQTFGQSEAYATEFSKVLHHLNSNTLQQVISQTLEQSVPSNPLSTGQLVNKTPASSLVLKLAQVIKQNAGSVSESPLPHVVADGLEKVVEIHSPGVRLMGTLWGSVAVETTGGTPLRHDLRKLQSSGDYCRITFEREPDERIKVVRGARVIRKKRRGEPTNSEIDFAVRGPVDRRRGLMSTMMSKPSKVRKLVHVDVEALKST